MDGCNVLLETQFVGTRLCVDTTRVLYVVGSLPPWGVGGERPEFNIKLPLGPQLLIFPRGYLLKYFPQDSGGLKSEFFPHLGELLKAIEPHLPIWQLCPWQLGPNMWSSPTTNRSYRPSDGLPMGKSRTGHMWIYLQLSGARCVDNGGVTAQLPIASC